MQTAQTVTAIRSQLVRGRTLHISHRPLEAAQSPIPVIRRTIRVDRVHRAWGREWVDFFCYAAMGPYRLELSEIVSVDGDVALA